MTMKKDYDEFMQRKEAFLQNGMAKCWQNQEARYIKPFQIFGNLYYVGDSWVCAHIVDTGEGLILFDAGNYGATALLIQAIWEAGFRPNDVKWLILSHGHVDHIGAANFFKKMFGTTIYLGAPDAKMFRTNPEFALLQANPNCMEDLCEPDVEIDDGKRIVFGNTVVDFFLVPGHTAGCIACFFHVTDGKQVKRVGYYGGFGFNTLEDKVLIEMGDPDFQTRKTYLNSLKKMRDEKVDIFMANHTDNVDLLNKCQYILEHPNENPFINETAWKEYLDSKREDLMSLYSLI